MRTSSTSLFIFFNISAYEEIKLEIKLIHLLTCDVVKNYLW